MSGFSVAAQWVCLSVVSGASCVTSTVMVGPLISGCCFLTDSLCLASVTTVSRVSSGSICSFSESLLSLIPTTILSLTSSLCIVAVFCQAVQISDELVDRFVTLLLPPIKPRSLVYRVASFNKVALELLFDRAILFGPSG